MAVNFTQFPGLPPQAQGQGVYNMVQGQPQRGSVFSQPQQLPPMPPQGVGQPGNPGNSQFGQGRQQAMMDWRGLRPEHMQGMDPQDWRTQMQDWRGLRPGSMGGQQPPNNMQGLAAMHAANLDMARLPTQQFAPPQQYAPAMPPQQQYAPQVQPQRQFAPQVPIARKSGGY